MRSAITRYICAFSIISCASLLVFRSHMAVTGELQEHISLVSNETCQMISGHKITDTRTIHEWVPRYANISSWFLLLRAAASEQDRVWSSHCGWNDSGRVVEKMCADSGQKRKCHLAYRGNLWRSQQNLYGRDVSIFCVSSSALHRQVLTQFLYRTCWFFNLWLGAFFEFDMFWNEFCGGIVCMWWAPLSESWPRVEISSVFEK